MNDDTETAAGARRGLRRALGLPLLVFYGVGVTIGAGIFALTAEIVAVAGDQAPLAFIVAGAVAGMTAVSYAVLGHAYPRAAGEVIFVREGMGRWAGRLVGLAIIAAAVASSAVIGLAFARYLASFTGIGEVPALIALIFCLGAIAAIGVRESVGFAALITVIETVTLLVVIAGGLPLLAESGAAGKLLALPHTLSEWNGVFLASLIAFFAFIGFEDIVNMAEETENPERSVPLAIGLTLVISLVVYVLVVLVAAALPDRQALIEARAPLAYLFEATTGRSGAAIAAMASVAMINGVLVQIVMASRVLYGMSREGMIASWPGAIHPTRQTPVRAVALVTGAIAVLALTTPLVQLAQLTSFVLLVVFAAVNASLFLIGRRSPPGSHLCRWRHWGLAGTAFALMLAMAELIR
jgi:amino acid transporter